MKKRILAVLIALIMAAAVMPITSAETTADWTVPEGYNEHDYNKIAAFLEQTDDNGVKNGEKYFSNYDVNDPETFYQNEPFRQIEFTEYQGELRLSYVCVSDVDSYGILDLTDCIALEYLSICGDRWGTGGHVTELLISGCESLEKLYCFVNQIAELDLSGCPSLVSLDCSANPLESIDLSVCPSLESFNCSDSGLTNLDASCNPNLYTIHVINSELTELDLSGCPELTSLWIPLNPISSIDLSYCPNLQGFVCEGCELTELDVSCCPNLHDDCVVVNNPLTEIDLSANSLLPLDLVRAEGEGTVGYVYQYRFYGEIVETTRVFAVPDEGASFLGWYTESGELLSPSAQYDFSGIIGTETVLIARFSGGEAIPGDINMNGSVEVSDAVLALRSAMGIIGLTPEQIEAGDMNESGAIDVTDAIIILRTAMGLLD